MKAIGIFAIDCWHLANGVHFPKVDTSNIIDYEDAIDWLVNIATDYDIRDNKGKKITRGYIAEATNEDGARIFFSYPREGYLILRQEK